MELRNKMMIQNNFVSNQPKVDFANETFACKVEHTYAFEFVKNYDKNLLEVLYKKYIELGVDSLTIINEEEFKKFIEICLPLYLKGEIKCLVEEKEKQ